MRDLKKRKKWTAARHQEATALLTANGMDDSLIEHTVPQDERALAGLAHAAMALDIYA